jgi:hypothetical protein
MLLGKPLRRGRKWLDIKMKRTDVDCEDGKRMNLAQDCSGICDVEPSGSAFRELCSFTFYCLPKMCKNELILER